ncbi:MAG: hypothetical protein AAGG51_10205 [Cyanobacteria bacterium P01_G01_bin.54]
MYLYGQDIDEILAKGTVIGVVNCQRIANGGRQKFEQAGIAYAHEIPEAEFLQIEA